MQRLDDGYNSDELKEVYGHSSIATTQRYADYRTGRLVDIMRGKKKVIVEAKSQDIEKIWKKWSGREDLNLRHLTPHASALPGCATPRSRPWNDGVIIPLFLFLFTIFNFLPKVQSILGQPKESVTTRDQALLFRLCLIHL